MNCENCGKGEVNFHYTSNINGNITEKHLCAECANKLGYVGRFGFMDRPAIGPESSFEEIFADLFGMRPPRRMLGSYGMVFPTFVIPTVSLIMPDVAAAQQAAAQAASPSIVPPDFKPEVDETMKKRREINMLREQMKKAAEAEDFEKAAALRDSIRRLENELGL
jgi:protein arginine kinase activator